MGSSAPSGSPLWGLTYSPYNDDGSCPDAGAVADQLQKVARAAKNVRLYSTDCSQLRNAAQAVSRNKLPLGIYAGIWVAGGDSRAGAEIDELVSVAKQYGAGIIRGVGVGNEEVSKGMPVPTLLGYISRVRARLQSEGLGGIPVYTAEQDAKFTKEMADASDLVQVNIHAVFDPAFTNIADSVQSVIARAAAVKSGVAGGKKVQIGETGWASAGNIGPSPLTLGNEAAYARQFGCAAARAGYEYFYFEAKDALWKQAQPQSEKSFGVFDSAYTPKFDLGQLGSC
ncbi:hypothetical protein H4R18_004555 [Coemansia javaensis]|uniref:glucan endo-1,3-beta-D-glucosidase n=1 Tax=Coemansia javaensis TaxID=2761396 RepID=A0A9W8H5T7_9FUNG|nr:hypothetical protein H4R18_004555 [Coemansia javaensis]